MLAHTLSLMTAACIWCPEMVWCHHPRIQSHGTAEKEEFDAKYKDLESHVSPLMAKLYGGGGEPSGAGPAGGAPMPHGAGKTYAGSAPTPAAGPKIEEVD